MSLAGVNSMTEENYTGVEGQTGEEGISLDPTTSAQYARIYTDKTIEKLRQDVANILSSADHLEDDEALDYLHKDKSTCTSDELDFIRRERNRIHAKRTRLRKKKMLEEMEGVSYSLLYYTYCIGSIRIHHI